MSAVAGIEDAQSPAMQRREALRREMVDAITDALHKIDVRGATCVLARNCYQYAEESGGQGGIAHGEFLLFLIVCWITSLCARRSSTFLHNCEGPEHWGSVEPIQGTAVGGVR